MSSSDEIDDKKEIKTFLRRGLKPDGLQFLRSTGALQESAETQFLDVVVIHILSLGAFGRTRRVDNSSLTLNIFGYPYPREYTMWNTSEPPFLVIINK